MTKPKRTLISVLPPNEEVDELIAREAFALGGAKMGMSEYLLRVAIEKSGGDVAARLAVLRAEQKHIPASAFKRGNRKRLFEHVQ